MTYWEKLTSEERKEVMAQRRAKGVAEGKIAGGMHYVDIETRKQILEKVRATRKQKGVDDVSQDVQGREG